MLIIQLRGDCKSPQPVRNYLPAPADLRYVFCSTRAIKNIDMSRNYKFYNPVEEGHVFRAEQYVYSSAIDYAGEKGLLDIILI